MEYGGARNPSVMTAATTYASQVRLEPLRVLPWLRPRVVNALHTPCQRWKPTAIIATVYATRTHHDWKVLWSLSYGSSAAPPGWMSLVVRLRMWNTMNSAIVTPPQRIVNDA